MNFATHFGQNVSRCESIIGYVFESKTLCGEALNAAADSMAIYSLDGTHHQMPKNIHLAILGDAVAALRVCSLWYDNRLLNGQ